MIPVVSQYAGQQLLTGQQAEVYADDFINVHLQEMGGGKTYSQLSSEAQAQPNNTTLVLLGLGTVSFLGGLFGFGRLFLSDGRKARRGAPAIEHINEAGHHAGTAS